MDTPTAGPDAHPPREIAHLVESLGVAKGRMDWITMAVLSVLAGAFISIGALLYLVAMTDPGLGFGPSRVFGGACFSLGLVLVVVAGAELFTGNNLLAMAWASGLLRTRDVLRSWVIVYAGNAVGCLATVALVVWADVASLGGGGVGDTAVRVAQAKAGLAVGAAFARGVLCNALVCLAVWLAMGGRSVADKILAIMFPITAFVALGLEHSIANLFLLPYGIALDRAGVISHAGAGWNIAVVTGGNLAGGTLLVAGVYWIAYLRNPVGRSA